MRRILAVIILIGALSSNVNGQDIHFTQLQNAPLTINPAATGLFDGWERVTVSHKNQWVNSGTKFFTSSISADASLLKKKGTIGPYMGVGLQLFRDVGGDSKFGTKQALLNVSSIIPLSDRQTFAAGLQVGFGQKSGDLSALTFSNQFDGMRIDPTKNSFEHNKLVSTIYTDFSAGLLYNYKSSRMSIARDDRVDFKLGVAYFHINKPSLKFRLGSTERLYAKWVINASLLKDFQGTNSGIEAYVNQAIQGPHSETLLGVLYRHRLNTGSMITGLSRDTYIKFGASYRHKDAISPLFYLEYSSYTFGVSYDVTISKFAQGSNAGGLEFSFTYANLDFALFKRRGPRF